MTIQEAIKTGKPFRRSNWYKSEYIHPNSTNYLYYGNADLFTPSKEDILAEDWEVKE